MNRHVWSAHAAHHTVSGDTFHSSLCRGLVVMAPRPQRRRIAHSAAVHEPQSGGQLAAALGWSDTNWPHRRWSEPRFAQQRPVRFADQGSAGP